MSDVEFAGDLWCSAGSVSTLPGSSHDFPEGTCCDKHEDRPAVKRIQGETDSFGCEYFLACQECYDKYKQDVIDARDEESRCDWCKTMQKGCSPMRDAEEGLGGPVYNVCAGCRKKNNDYWAAELEAGDPDPTGYYMDDDRFEDDVEPDMMSASEDDIYDPRKDDDVWEAPPKTSVRQIFVNPQTSRIYRGPGHHAVPTVVMEIPKRVSRKKLRKMAMELTRSLQEKTK